MWRRRFWLLLAVGVLVVAGAVAVILTPEFQKWYYPPVLVVPADDEVAEMRVSLRNFGDWLEAVPEFVVPPEHVPRILGWLRPAEYVSQPPIFPEHGEMGEVVIRTRDGREQRLRLCWAGKNPVVITRDGVDHFWGQGFNDADPGSAYGVNGLINAVRAAHRAAKR